MERTDQLQASPRTPVSIGEYRASAIEGGAPLLALGDPTPVEARRALAPLALAARLGDRDQDDLRSAVSEVVTNAIHYGEPPVRLRGWADGGLVVVTVTDRGPGPSESDLGLAPLAREAGQGGLGLWMARRMCRELVMGTGPDGFTVRLVFPVEP